MKVIQISRRLLPALTFACAMGVAPLAMAQTAAAPAGTMAPMAAPAAPAAAMAPVAAKPVAAKLTKAEMFKTEAAAQASCPGDTVVWSTMTKSKVLHASSSKYFGKTKHGAFVCEKTAEAAGYHLAKN
ncbi:hypothetical protein [Acidocella sp.]|uniref:hypothetical protein n=1 Tax=Acidocella sp. TaxID=50710 RepID=UPI00261C6C08|nr:hypothetical protein [Acidocella sp.]MDD2794547.1 hypothetical protein [Acidocella sp.]